MRDRGRPGGPARRLAREPRLPRGALMDPVTKPGQHGELYLHEIEYRDEDPAAPVFRTRVWAYNFEHALEKFWLGEDSDGWVVLRIARVLGDINAPARH